MIEIIIIIYFAINIFLSGYWFNENYRWENTKYAINISLLCIFFGVIGYLFYYILILFSPLLGWIYREIQFKYRFYFTKYWDKILLDDSYSQQFRTKEEKLNKFKEFFTTKTEKRHYRAIYNKYK